MAATIRYIGNYDVAAEGKIIWEILCQLKGLGVGRYVVKSDWTQKWPDQPSYLKIVNARPKMDRWLHNGKIWAEWTFRGHKMGIYEFGSDLNRADWKLVHKHEEAKLLTNPKKMETIELPDSFPLPPLQVLTSKRYAARIGQKWSDKQERAPLDVCLDPQFEIYKDFIRQKQPEKTAKSIYDEVNPEAFLSLYGKLLPPRIASWNLGPAEYKPRFSDN